MSVRLNIYLRFRSCSQAGETGVTESTEKALGAELVQLIETLLPVVSFAAEWDLGDALTLALGLAIEPGGSGSGKMG